MSESTSRRWLSPSRNRDVGDGLSKAFEMVVTPAVFAVLGWLLDRWLGTTPVFVIGFAALALIGKFTAEWYRYAAAMDELDAERASGRDDTETRVRLNDAASDDTGGLPRGVTLSDDTSATAATDRTGTEAHG